MSLLSWIKSFKGRRARERYEFLKSEISKRHFAGYAGLIVDFKRDFSPQDLASFKPPMYAVVKNADMKWCIFWDRQRLAQEIGTGAPLKEGEILATDKEQRRTRPDTAQDIDDQKPLTQTAPNPEAVADPN